MVLGGEAFSTKGFSTSDPVRIMGDLSALSLSVLGPNFNSLSANFSSASVEHSEMDHLSSDSLIVDVFSVETINVGEGDDSITISGQLKVDGTIKYDNVRPTSFLENFVFFSGEGESHIHQFKEIQHSDGSLMSGWVWSDGSSQKTTTVQDSEDSFYLSSCGPDNSNHSFVSKTISDLPVHAHLELSASAHFLGSWTGETMFIRVNDEIVWLSSHDNGQKIAEPVKVTVPYDSNSVLLSVGSTITTAAKDCTAFWVLDQLSMSIRH